MKQKTVVKCNYCNNVLMKISDPLTIRLISISREGIEMVCPKCAGVNKFTFGIHSEPDGTIKDRKLKQMNLG